MSEQNQSESQAAHAASPNTLPGMAALQALQAACGAAAGQTTQQAPAIPPAAPAASSPKPSTQHVPAAESVGGWDDEEAESDKLERSSDLGKFTFPVPEGEDSWKFPVTLVAARRRLNVLDTFPRKGGNGEPKFFTMWDFVFGAMVDGKPCFIAPFPMKFVYDDRSHFVRMYRALNAPNPDGDFQVKNIRGKAGLAEIEMQEFTSKKGNTYMANASKVLSWKPLKPGQVGTPREELLPYLPEFLAQLAKYRPEYQTAAAPAPSIPTPTPQTPKAEVPDEDVPF